MKPVTFIDRAKIRVHAGNGGNGCCSFRREKFVPKGGPDGGDGGHGGDVILLASKDVDSLIALYFQPHQRAEHGEPGSGQQCHGRNGKDLLIKVPPGTEARLENGELLGEVIEDGQTLRVAKGGRGGIGNPHFASSTHQTPREFTKGTPGEEQVLWLELKSVADVGLVGYPNAGKSTLLAAISSARPKTAPYPFTTLHPVIGTVIYDDYRRLRVADIPGLIDGAHRGVGLGHDFLRHIERTRFLVFVIDMAGVDGRRPWEDYASLRKELGLHRAELNQLPFVVAANKMDLEPAAENLKQFVAETGQPAVALSAETGEGIEAFKLALYNRVLVQ